MTIDRPRAGAARHYMLIGALLLPTATALGVFSSRVTSLFHPAGRLLATSGGEPVSIYNALKIQRGLPLYEDPRDPPYYPTTLYNVGFYHFYAWLTWPQRSEFARLVLSMRLLTLGLTTLVFVVFLAYASLVWQRRQTGMSPRLTNLALGATGAGTLLGPLTGWWVVTVRPDLGAAVCAGIGLVVVLLMQERRPRASAILAGLCLAAAWSFKQSSVLIAVGLVLAAIWRRRFDQAILLVFPGLISAGLCLCLLGPEYRTNVIWATSLPSFAWNNAGRVAAQVLFKGGPTLLLAGLAIAHLRKAKWILPSERITLLTCWITTMVGGLVACSRTGSEVNYFFEMWLVTTLLAMVAVKFLLDSPIQDVIGPRFVTSLLLSAALLASGMDGARLLGLRGGQFGQISLILDPLKLEELQRASKLVRMTEGDVYCQPALSGLAWAPKFPAPMLDDEAYFHQPAARLGLLRGPGPEGLMAKHYYSLVIAELTNQRLITSASKAGYVRQPGWKTIAILAPAKRAEQSRPDEEVASAGTSSAWSGLDQR